MTQNDNMLDMQAIDGKFQGSRCPMHPFLLGRDMGDEIGNVAHDEDLAGASIKDRFGCRATVTTADQHDFGLLAFFCQFLVAGAFGLKVSGSEGFISLEQSFW